jgi:hypothetical protein
MGHFTLNDHFHAGVVDRRLGPLIAPRFDERHDHGSTFTVGLALGLFLSTEKALGILAIIETQQSRQATVSYIQLIHYHVDGLTSHLPSDIMAGVVWVCSG